MNPKDRFDDFQADERGELARLAETADSLQPSDQFVKRAEMQLKDAFAAKKEKHMKRFNLLWQLLAGTAAIAALTLGTIWLVRRVAPEPRNPAAPDDIATATSPANTSTPEATPAPTVTPEIPTYEWHGTTVYRAVDFPQAPTEAGVYTHSSQAAATIESARKLAERFGIQGEVYLDSSGSTGANGFLVTDGKQRLSMSSAGQFSYYADYSKALIEAPVPLDTASGAIDAFLKARGFDFTYQLEVVNGVGAGWFYVIPLSLDDRPVRFDFGLVQGLTVRVSPDGQVIGLDAYLLNVDSQSVGKFGLISAEDAWQKLLQDVPFGVIQSSRSSDAERFSWQRSYPDNQPVTLYGNLTSFASVETGKPASISVNGFTATGNTAGMEKPAYNTFVQAQGQFFTENGLRTFKVDAWQVFDETKLQYFQGSLRSDGGKIIFSSQGTDYSLADAPEDLPAPAENVSITGMTNGALLDWQYILYLKNLGQGGGGGGCGGSFAKLNLSGAPVPWLTSTPVISPSELPTGQRIEGKRGTLSIGIYEQKDGSKRTNYYLYTPDASYVLEGQGLEKLVAYHNRPVTIWGAVTSYNEYKSPVVTVERFEIPYPDLKFQILRGTQKQITVDGQQVTLFTTTDGKSYVQLMPAGIPDNSLVGVEGDLVEYELLIVPDETFGGYPAMRVFSGGMATNPKTGQPFEMQITADQPSVMPEPEAGSSPTPTLTLDAVELVYYTPNPQYAASYPDAMTPYIQPVWRFSAHFSDGSLTEILIQALKPDFLLPEAAPALQCG